MNLTAIQDTLRAETISAWLLTDWHGKNDIALKILGFPPDAHASRRWFYLIPATGAPVKLVHAVEPRILDHLPGSTAVYLSRDSLLKALEQILAGRSAVAMEYSPMGSIPNASLVDAGTIEIVRHCMPGTKGTNAVVSSANLLQKLSACWSPDALASHRRAATMLRTTMDHVWNFIADHMGSPDLTEYTIQKFIMNCFANAGYITQHAPVVAVDAHAADPHYSPEPGTASIITPDSLVLVDMWARENTADAIYADITWTAFTGSIVPEKILHVFEIVRNARDAAVTYLETCIGTGVLPTGAELDRACRQVIETAGYGRCFVHRTGHSLHTDVHGPGANIDSLESNDIRRLLPGTGFTIEPGIYLPGEFGVRLEIDVALLPDGSMEITGQPIQRDIVRIHAE